MQAFSGRLDPRVFQVLFQGFFLAYGLCVLEWQGAWLCYAAYTGGALCTNYAWESGRRRRLLPLRGQAGFVAWGLSALITAFSLCLLLKTNHAGTALLAAVLAVSSKYFLRWKTHHVFNPSAFGMVATIMITHDAWLSPGQWGTAAVLFFTILTLGTIVVTRVQQLDSSLAFLLTYTGLLFWRQVWVLGWPADYFLHATTTGSLLLFSFFMITDPKTTPRHRLVRMAWAAALAAVSFFLAAFRWQNNTPIWVLVAMAPLVPVLNHWFKAKAFEWRPVSFKIFPFLTKQKIHMHSTTKKWVATLLLVAMVGHEAMAFCGFYVSKADGTLKNKTSQVILVRDGDRNVITMYNDFQDDFKDFAMVVPVPAVLRKSDIKVVDQQIFSTLNEYSKPRLVAYYDENPCMQRMYKELAGAVPGVALNEVPVSGYRAQRKSLGVHIEAKYLVGEYDILILSAKESAGLKTWLTENGYKIPRGAEEVLEPYIKSNLKFFVVKVNEAEKKKLPGNFLRPIQISYRSSRFMLPIRLGMANADGDQDLLVYAFTRTGRIECTNYRTVALPSGEKVPLFVQNNFGSFYSNLFQHQWNRQGHAVAMLEYAWDVSPQNFVKCDPCIATAPSTQDLLQAGVWWVGHNWSDYSDVEEDNVPDLPSNVYFTRLHVRYNRHDFPQDLMFQATPNTENFQARYVITHPADGDFSCEAGKQYLRQLKQRRREELRNLTELTGKSYEDWDVASSSEPANIPHEDAYASISVQLHKETDQRPAYFLAGAGLLGLALLLRRKKHGQS